MNRIHDETSLALLDAAHRLLADEGSDALTVRRIAHEAGMSTMNVYSRFGGKDGVIDELYRDGYERLGNALSAGPSTDDVTNDFMHLANTYRGFALDNPTYYGIMFRSTVPGFEPSAESTELALGSLRSFVSRVELGQDRGHIVSTPEYGSIEVAACLWAFCHGLVSLELEQVAAEFVSWSAIFDNGMRTAIAGLHPSVAAIPQP